MPRQPQTKAQRALAIGRKIGELETEVRPILQAIAELKREHELLFSPWDDPNAEDEAEAAADRPPPRKAGRPKKVASQEAPQEWKPLAARVLSFFQESGAMSADLDTIGEAIGHANRQSLRACMVTLYKEHKLRRVGKGVYAPAEPKATTLVVIKR